MKKGQIEMLTARQYSERAGVSYPTVMKWLRAGLIPGAKLNENTPLGTYWEIPATSVGAVTKEKPGPKPKKTDDDEPNEGQAQDDELDEAPVLVKARKTLKKGEGGKKLKND